MDEFDEVACAACVPSMGGRGLPRRQVPSPLEKARELVAIEEKPDAHDEARLHPDTEGRRAGGTDRGGAKLPASFPP